MIKNTPYPANPSLQAPLLTTDTSHSMAPIHGIDVAILHGPEAQKVVIDRTRDALMSQNQAAYDVWKMRLTEPSFRALAAELLKEPEAQREILFTDPYFEAWRARLNQPQETPPLIWEAGYSDESDDLYLSLQHLHHTAADRGVLVMQQLLADHEDHQKRFRHIKTLVQLGIELPKGGIVSIIPNFRDQHDSESALMLAVRTRDVDLLELLLPHSADPLETPNALNALHYAMIFNDEAMVERLLSVIPQEALLKSFDNGASLAHLALAMSPEMVNRFRSMLDFEQRDDLGRTPLLNLIADPLKIYWGHWNVPHQVKAFQAALQWCDRSATDHTGQDALMLFATSGCWADRRNKVDVNFPTLEKWDLTARDDFGETALYKASILKESALMLALEAELERRGFSSEDILSLKTPLSLPTHSPRLAQLSGLHKMDVERLQNDQNDQNDQGGENTQKMQSIQNIQNAFVMGQLQLTREAILRDDTNRVKEWLDAGVDVNGVSEGSCLLSLALEHSESSTLLLLERGAQLTYTDDFAQGALVAASKANKTDLVELLLSRMTPEEISDQVGHALWVSTLTYLELIRPFSAARSIARQSGFDEQEALCHKLHITELLLSYAPALPPKPQDITYYHSEPSLLHQVAHSSCSELLELFMPYYPQVLQEQASLPVSERRAPFISALTYSYNNKACCERFMADDTREMTLAHGLTPKIDHIYRLSNLSDELFLEVLRQIDLAGATGTTGSLNQQTPLMNLAKTRTDTIMGKKLSVHQHDVLKSHLTPEHYNAQNQLGLNALMFSLTQYDDASRQALVDFLLPNTDVFAKDIFGETALDKARYLQRPEIARIEMQMKILDEHRALDEISKEALTPSHQQENQPGKTSLVPPRLKPRQRL